MRGGTIGQKKKGPESGATKLTTEKSRTVSTATLLVVPRGKRPEQSACFVVRDHNDQVLAHVYFEDEPGRRSAAKLLSRDDARRIVSISDAFADIPGLFPGLQALLECLVAGAC